MTDLRFFVGKFNIFLKLEEGVGYGISLGVVQNRKP